MVRVNVGEVDRVDIVDLAAALPERAGNGWAAVDLPLFIVRVDHPQRGGILRAGKGAPAAKHIYFHLPSPKFFAA